MYKLVPQKVIDNAKKGGPKGKHRGTKNLHPSMYSTFLNIAAQ